MHPDVQTKVQRLVYELQHLFDTHLVSVCVYGSALQRDAQPAQKKHLQDINVLVILSEIDYKDLEKASSISKWWEKTAHALPVFMSEEEWGRSADAFALEYADIRDNHHVAFGKDLYSETQLDVQSLRLVCELELHRKLVYLRQRLLLYRDKPEVILDMLQHHVSSYTALFRGIIRLKRSHNEVPQTALDTLTMLKDIVPGFNESSFEKILHSKEVKGHIASAEVMTICHDVLEQLDLVTHFVDQCHEFAVSKA